MNFSHVVAAIKVVCVGTFIALGGCGSSPPVSDPKSIATDLPAAEASATDATAAEVAGPFEGLETVVAAPDVPKTPPDEKPAIAANTQTKKPTASRPAEIAPPLPLAVAAPTAEQLTRWSIEPYEPLQLLRCRDGGAAGLLTGIETLGSGGHYALAGSRITLWSLMNDQLEKDLSDPANEQLVKSLATRGDGSWLATGDSKGNLQIWDVPDGKLRIAKKIYPSGVAHLAVSPNGEQIATASYTGEVTLWTVQPLAQKSTFKAADQALQRIMYVDNEHLMVSAQDTGLWNTHTGKLEQSLTQGGYSSVQALAPDGKQLVYGHDSKLMLWNITDAKDELTFAGSVGTNDLVAFSPDGRRLVTASKFAIQILDANTGQILQIIDTFGWETVGVRWLANPSLLLIASENGRVRLWGNAADAKSLDWKPLHGESEKLSTAKDSASAAKLIQSADIRSLPKLPGAGARADSETLVNYAAPVTIDEAKVFYDYLLTQRGWSLSPIPGASPDQRNYLKPNMRLSVYLSNNGDGTSGINLSLGSEVDLRRLPKSDASPVEIVFENEEVVQYRTKTDLLKLEIDLLRKFQAAGWTAYAQLNTSHNEDLDGREMQFIRDATLLRVSIQRPPVDPSSYHVSYGKNWTTKSLPIPKDSGFVEFDGSTVPLLVANTAKTLTETREFYETEMAAEGWLRRDTGKQFTEKSGWMDFIRGQSDVVLVFDSLPDGGTRIRVGNKLENASWQLKKVAAREPAAAASGLEAADFPALNDWKIVKYDPEEKRIDLVANGATTAAVADAYTESLSKLGWKTDGRGVKSPEYLLATFTHEKAELTLRARLADGQVEASFSGDGLLWSKPLLGPKKIISYEAWLRTNRYPSTLDRVDEYAKEMAELNTTK